MSLCVLQKAHSLRGVKGICSVAHKRVVDRMPRGSNKQSVLQAPSASSPLIRSLNK